MNYKRARILSLIFYAAAVILFFVRAFAANQETLLHAATGGMFLFVLLGFYLNYKFLRCPKCGRVMKATMNPERGCPYCKEPLLDGDKKGE